MSDTGNDFNLKEYEENPFIAKLPRLQSVKEMRQSLASYPEINDHEKSLPPHIRKHCIARLSRYFEPMQRQFKLAEKVGLLIRQGYVGRNPVTSDYLLHLQNGLERINTNSMDLTNIEKAESTASSFALIGCSGIGKTKSIEKILRQYRQCIQHEHPVCITQITWLRIECPSMGSPKQLCINFFFGIDRILGTSYLKWYGSGTLDIMMLHMAHIANLHAIGVIVIDEIQHLNDSKVGPEAILNFLVTLVNTIGVPVIPIGTPSAFPVLQKNFRQARRSSSLGSMTWDRFENDSTWNYFISKLWKYQWTTEITELDEELKTMMYEESAGIIDVAISIFILSQFRLLDISAVRQRAEKITPHLLKKVAREELQMIQPMLDAIRKNDKKALLKFDDLRSLKTYMNEVLSNAMHTNVATENSADMESDNPKLPENSNIESVLENAIKALGIANDIAQVIIKEVKSKEQSDDPLLLMSLVMEQLKTKGSKKKTRAKKGEEKLSQDDLRNSIANSNAQENASPQSWISGGQTQSPISDLLD